MFRLTMQGPTQVGPTPGPAAGRDLTTFETAVLAPLLVLIVALGLFPNLLLGYMEASASQLVATVQTVRQQASRAMSIVDEQ